MCSYQSYFIAGKGCITCSKDSYAPSVRSSRCFACKTEISEDLTLKGLSAFEIAKLQALCDYDKYIGQTTFISVTYDPLSVSKTAVIIGILICSFLLCLIVILVYFICRRQCEWTCSKECFKACLKCKCRRSMPNVNCKCECNCFRRRNLAQVYPHGNQLTERSQTLNNAFAAMSVMSERRFWQDTEPPL